MLRPLRRFTSYLVIVLFAMCVADVSAGRMRVVGPDGDDKHPGTDERPWKSLAHAVQAVEPGDTVLIRGGEYAAGVVLRQSGTRQQPITFRAAEGERPVINGHGETSVGLVLDGVRFVRIQGLEFREIRTPHPRRADVLHNQGAILLRNSSDCWIVGNRIVSGGLPGYDENSPGATGVQLWSRASGNGCHRNLILGNDISQCAYAVHFRGPARHNLVEGNRLSGNQEMTSHSDAFKAESIDFELNHPKGHVATYRELAAPAWAEHTPRENVIRFNLCRNNSDDGIDTWISVRTLVEYNFASRSGVEKPGDGNGFKLGPGGRNFIRFNLSRGNRVSSFTDNGAVVNLYRHNFALGTTRVHDGVTVFETVEQWDDHPERQRIERTIRQYHEEVADTSPVATDVLIYDATPAGITAAIAAARSGRRVTILSQYRHIGGMQTSGLGNTNTGQRQTIGGLTREFHHRVLQHYESKYGADSPQVQSCDGGFRFEPHVAEHVYQKWLREAGVTLLMQEAIASVEKEGNRLIAVRTERGRRITATVFIDATYEGDLLALAGCSYRIGREGRKEYGESLAGVRYPPEQEGEADEKIQPYDYRLCLTDVPENRIPFRRPVNYDPEVYAFEAARLRHDPPEELHQLVPLNRMPNGKTDSRTGEWVGASWNWPEASRGERLIAAQDHRDYAEGYLWFLLTDDSVPPRLREELGQWGYAKDEFVDNGNWSYRLYVRQARRLVGEFVMTQRDVTVDRFKANAVALGSFFLDVHPVQRVPAADAVGGLVPEGSLGKRRVKPYEISWRALLPQRNEANNLLVPVCLSASHVAYSTIRMEPVYMMLGHACGVGAAMSLEPSTAPHDLPIDRLQERLRQQGQILDARPFTEEWPFRRD